MLTSLYLIHYQQSKIKVNFLSIPKLLLGKSKISVLFLFFSLPSPKKLWFGLLVSKPIAKSKALLSFDIVMDLWSVYEPYKTLFANYVRSYSIFEIGCKFESVYDQLASIWMSA